MTWAKGTMHLAPEGFEFEYHIGHMPGLSFELQQLVLQIH